MEITERDIFNFVFFKSSVSSEKIKFIKEKNEFSTGIKFYQALKAAIGKNIPVEVKNKLKEKIPAYNSLIYILNPVKDKVRKKKVTDLILAADSPKIKSKMTSATFIDDEKHYLIKLHNFENSAKIYVFSTNEEQIKNYKIIIRPSNRIYEQTDNSKPLSIDFPIEASSIELQFN